MKVCSKCREELDESAFYKRKDSPDGLSYECRECRRKVVRKYYKDNTHIWKEYRVENLEEIKEKKRNRRQRRRLTILTHYGGDPPHCECCGESNIEFLTIDHINNDGAEHRKEIGGSAALPKWIIDNGFPDGFRVLCYNCNCSIGSYGYCPHDT